MKYEYLNAKLQRILKKYNNETHTQPNEAHVIHKQLPTQTIPKRTLKLSYQKLPMSITNKNNITKIYSSNSNNYAKGKRHKHKEYTIKSNNGVSKHLQSSSIQSFSNTFRNEKSKRMDIRININKYMNNQYYMGRDSISKGKKEGVVTTIQSGGGNCFSELDFLEDDDYMYQRSPNSIEVVKCKDKKMFSSINGEVKQQNKKNNNEMSQQKKAIKKIQFNPKTIVSKDNNHICKQNNKQINNEPSKFKNNVNDKIHSHHHRSSKIKSLDNINCERRSTITSQHKEKLTTKPLQIKTLNKSEDEILSPQTIIISSPKPTQPKLNTNDTFQKEKEIEIETIPKNTNSKNLDIHIAESKQTNENINETNEDVHETIVPIISPPSLNTDIIKQIKRKRKILKIDINNIEKTIVNKDEESDKLSNKSFTSNTETKVTFKNDTIINQKRHSKFRQKKSLSIIPKTSSTNLNNFDTNIQTTNNFQRRMSIKYNPKQIPIPQLLKETPKYKSTYKRRASVAIFSSFQSSAFKFFTSSNTDKISTPLNPRTPKYYNNFSSHITYNIVNDSISQTEAEDLTNAIFNDVLCNENNNENKLNDYCDIDFNSKFYNKLKRLCIEREIQLKPKKFIDICNQRKQSCQSYLNNIVSIFKESIMYNALIKEIKSEFKDTLNEIIRRETANTLSNANTDENNFFFLIIIQYQLRLNVT